MTDLGSVYDVEAGVEYLGHGSWVSACGDWVFGRGGGGVRTWRLGMIPLVGVGDMTASRLMGRGCCFEWVGDGIKLKLIGMSLWLVMCR